MSHTTLLLLVLTGIILKRFILYWLTIVVLVSGITYLAGGSWRNSARISAELCVMAAIIMAAHILILPT